MKDQLIGHTFWRWGWRTTHSLFQFDALNEASSGIRWILRAFYLFLFILAFSSLGGLTASFDMTPMDALWPIELLSSGGVDGLLGWLHLFFIMTSALAVVAHRYRLVRVLQFVSLFFYSAGVNSFGKIDHGWHLMLFCSFFFIFLSLGKQNDQKIRDSLFFASAQYLILFTYTISGFWKLMGGLAQWRGGETSIFSLDGLSNQIAHRLLQTDSQSLFGEWLIRHDAFGFVLMLGAVYLELCSVFIFFRPRVHRLWGVLLISMHLSIFLAMTIGFTNSVWIVGLLFVLSPFAMNGALISKGALTDLPIFGNLFLLLQRLKAPTASLLFFDGECGTCDRFVTFVLRRGKSETLRFAPLDGTSFAALENTGESLKSFDTVVYREATSGEVHTHSRAIFLALQHSSNGWKWIGAMLLLIPRELADLGYLLFAPIRKSLFKASCPIPTSEERQFFMD